MKYDANTELRAAFGMLPASPTDQLNAAFAPFDQAKAAAQRAISLAETERDVMKRHVAAMSRALGMSQAFLVEILEGRIEWVYDTVNETQINVWSTNSKSETQAQYEARTGIKVFYE